MKDNQGRPVTRVELIDDATDLVTSDGRPVVLVTEYEDGVEPSDGRLVLPMSVELDEGQPIVPIALVDDGTLIADDGRPVHAMTGVTASGEPTTIGVTPPVLLMRFTTLVNEVNDHVPYSQGGNITGGSWNSDGSGDKIVFDTDPRDYVDVTDDFTFEAHYDSNAAMDGSLISRAASGATRFWVYIDNGGLVMLIVGESTILTGATNVHDLSGFVHIACVKDNTAGRWTLYINGVEDATAVSTAKNTAATTNITIGASTGFEGTQTLNGSIDRIKITRDCLYPYASGNFTPPARTDS